MTTRKLSLEQSATNLITCHDDLAKLASTRTIAINSITEICFEIVAKFSIAWNDQVDRVIKPMLTKKHTPINIQLAIIEDIARLLPVLDTSKRPITELVLYNQYNNAVESVKRGQLATMFSGEISTEIVNGVVFIEFYPDHKTTELGIIECQPIELVIPKWIIELQERKELELIQVTHYITKSVVAPYLETLDLDKYSQVTDLDFVIQTFKNLNPTKALELIEFIKTL